MQTEPRHPIGVVAERTGLSQDVLRVWERRYSAVSPGRGNGGQRLYSDADIDRLRLLVRATGAGRSIGQVAVLPTGELETLVRDDERSRVADARLGVSEEAKPTSTAVGRGIALAHGLDGVALEAELRRAVAVMGLPSFLDLVAEPFVRRLGAEGRSGEMRAAHAQFAEAIVRGVAASAVHAIPIPAADAPSIVVSTLAGERSETEAILAVAMAIAEGWGATYLGADLPAGEIADAALATDARVVAVSVTSATDEVTLLAELGALRDRLPPSVAIIGCGLGVAVVGIKG